MNACDAYVSLHRAEGFGLTLAETMALGKPALATAYGGNLEFMNEKNSYLVPYTFTGIPAGCDPYPAGSRWAEPDLDAAAELMRHIVEHRDAAHETGARARRDILELHSPSARANSLRMHLAAVRDRHSAMRSDRTLAEPTPKPADDFRKLHAWANLHVPMNEGGKSPVALLRKLLHRVLLPLFHRQTEINAANTRLLTTLRAAVEAQQKTIRDLSETIAILKEDGNNQSPRANDGERGVR
jgi:hypothetical protein